MAIGILGRKLGMTRVFGNDGNAIACTVVQAGPCPVMQIRRPSGEGYSALQLAFEPLKESHVTKPLRGHQAKAGKGTYRTLREFRLDTVEGYELGQELTVDLFAPGDIVKVTGTSKGKGFQGPMKRWNFAGLPASHGHEKVHRSGGSIGHNTEPGKVMRGKKMAGQMGAKRVTAPSLEVIDVRPEDNIIIIKGAVPGPRNGLLLVTKSK